VYVVAELTRRLQLLLDEESLWQRHESPGSLDAVLAAACVASGATLVSADKAFARVRGLDHVVPEARGVNRLIAG
jgi:predicted nucleic acid-binding protein